MKLTEIKNKSQHYFIDEQDRFQGEYKYWHDNGQLSSVCYFRDGDLHGEFKTWHSNGLNAEMCHFRDGDLHGEYKGWDSSGNLIDHTFDIGGKEVIDFIENPELYPETPEERTMFVLKYGNAPLIRESEDE